MTPNILPGDRIVVTEGTDTDEVTVDDIRFTGPPVSDPATGDVLVRGIAQRADGTTIAPSTLDSGEFRDDTGELRLAPTRTEATAGVTNGCTMRYTAPYAIERNRLNLSPARIKSALMTQNGHTTGIGHTEVLPLESMLVDGLADVPGPAAGCESSPAAEPGTPPVPPPPPATDTVAPTVTGRSPASGPRASPAPRTSRPPSVRVSAKSAAPRSGSPTTGARSWPRPSATTTSPRRATMTRTRT